MKKIRLLSMEVGVAATFALLVYAIAEKNIVSSLFTVVVINMGLEYYFEIYVAKEKVIAKRRFESNFNSDYFDLYWGFNKNKIRLTLNSELTILQIAAQIFRNYDVLPKLGVFIFVFWLST